MSFPSILTIARIPKIRKKLLKPLQGVLAVIVCLSLWSCDSRSSVEVATDKGILIMGNSSEPKGLDPHVVSGVLENNIIRSLFEGLVIEHHSKNGEYLPGVAETVERDENSTVWTFHLRKEARWSDGHPLTCLLYTSPSPRDRTRSRMPSSA